jgi:hypothetical protein
MNFCYFNTYKQVPLPQVSLGVASQLKLLYFYRDSDKLQQIQDIITFGFFL